MDVLLQYKKPLDRGASKGLLIYGVDEIWLQIPPAAEIRQQVADGQ